MLRLLFTLVSKVFAELFSALLRLAALFAFTRRSRPAVHVITFPIGVESAVKPVASLLVVFWRGWLAEEGGGNGPPLLTLPTSPLLLVPVGGVLCKCENQPNFAWCCCAGLRERRDGELPELLPAPLLRFLDIWEFPPTPSMRPSPL